MKSLQLMLTYRGNTQCVPWLIHGEGEVRKKTRNLV